MLKNYKELKVWQKSYGLCLEIYRITGKFPKNERYSLTSQTRRSAVSVPSNMADGKQRQIISGYSTLHTDRYVSWKLRSCYQVI
ncbi:MAG: four helix bundle protein [Desulfosarcina sp.]|nr:four helix bundle protein [Desulfosarcina sp.]MBC2745317.1 four helix bundle protein [Desulfosarcina sp.]MBC2768222.1 four helix bundle protein [Desulfosarcina sp.]